MTEEKETVQVLFTQEGVIKSDVVSVETKRDPVLRKVLFYTRLGMTEKSSEELLSYYSKRMDITNEDYKLIWNDRVIIPISLREIRLNDLHAEHLGIVKTKQLARKYLWWPMIDRDVETKQKNVWSAKKQQRNHLTQQAKWSWHVGLWKRLHLDFAAPCEGKMF